MQRRIGGRGLRRCRSRLRCRPRGFLGGALLGVALFGLAPFALRLLGKLRRLPRGELGVAPALLLAQLDFAAVDLGGGAGGASTAVACWPSPASRLTNTRFLRTSTWIVRALPEESAFLISLVCLRVSVILFFPSAAPCDLRR